MAREWDGNTYDRIATPQEDWGRIVLTRFTPKPGARILDAGCGSGRVTALLLDQRPDVTVVALDGSAAMLDEARTRLAGHRDRVEFMHADLRQPLPITEPVDAVVSTATFHWLTDHEQLFGHLASVAADDAILCAQWGGVGNIQKVTNALDDQGVEWRDDTYFATVDATVAAMGASGWAVDDCWLEATPTPFADDAALAQWLRTVILGPQLARRSATEADALVQTVVRAIPDHVLDYVRINALAHMSRT